jgi:UDP-N-acetylmuramyl tripeptide synthase
VSTLDAKVAAAQTLGRLARRAGRGGGTSLPGKVLTRLAPDAIRRLADRLPDGCAVISATNGKTTTAAMVDSVLGRQGRQIVANRAGANMAGGVASALLDAARWGGEIDGQFGLFEVDEFWLDTVVPALEPRSVLLANLFRDQLDRYGELETIADRWAAMVSGLGGGTALVLNADDPLIADLGRERHSVTYFGIDDRSLAMPEMQHASDSKHCRNCGAAYVYETVYLGHLGVYACPSCGRTRPEPAVTARNVSLHGTRSASFTLHMGDQAVDVQLPLPGLYNVYNALGAAALCGTLAFTPTQIADGLSHVGAAFGRSERIELGDHELSVLLIKNPAGANEVLRTLRLEPGGLDLFGILNDRTADGRDVSWIWDADFELLTPVVRRVTCSGTRAAELAVRLKYAGVDEDKLYVEHDLSAALDRSLATASAHELFVLPTYTALLELRAELGRRGHVDSFWEMADR